MWTVFGTGVCLLYVSLGVIKSWFPFVRLHLLHVLLLTCSPNWDPPLKLPFYNYLSQIWSELLKPDHKARHISLLHLTRNLSVAHHVVPSNQSNCVCFSVSAEMNVCPISIFLPFGRETKIAQNLKFSNHFPIPSQIHFLWFSGKAEPITTTIVRPPPSALPPFPCTPTTTSVRRPIFYH